MIMTPYLLKNGWMGRHGRRAFRTSGTYTYGRSRTHHFPIENNLVNSPGRHSHRPRWTLMSVPANRWSNGHAFKKFIPNPRARRSSKYTSIS